MSMDYIHRDTFYHKLHPVTKMVHWLVLMLSTMCIDDPIALFLVLLSILLVFYLAKLPKERLVELIKIILPATVMYVLLDLIFFRAPPESTFLFYLVPWVKWVPVTVESLVWVAGVVLKFFIILISFRLIPLTTPISDIMRTLTKFRVPPSIVTAISSGLAYVPVMYNEARTIEDAQRARGLRLEYRNPIKRGKALTVLLVPILSCSIQRSMQLAMAIESRGFGYKAKNRTYLRELHFSKSDGLVLFVCATVAFAFVYLGRWWTNILNYTITTNLIKNLIK